MDAADADKRVTIGQGDAEELTGPELIVDGFPVAYGQFPDGVKFLYENAYQWSDDLRELGRQLVMARSQNRQQPEPRAPEGGQ